ncbi:hypothetical protein ACHAXM_005550 [Skeletonema potamos]
MKINTCLLSSIRDGGCSSPFHRASNSESYSTIFAAVQKNDLLGGINEEEAAAAAPPSSSSHKDVEAPVVRNNDILPTSSSIPSSADSIYPTFRGLNNLLSSPEKEEPAKKAVVTVDDDNDKATTSLLDRSQARRMKLQQSYNEIKNNTTTQQQLQLGEEQRDDDVDDDRVNWTLASIKSPRLRKLFILDVRNDDNEETNDEETYHATTTTTTATTTPSQHQFGGITLLINNNNNNKNDKSGSSSKKYTSNMNTSAQLRREYRKTLQKSSHIDIAEIEQFTKDMRMRIQRYNNHDNNTDDGSSSSSPKMVDEEKDNVDGGGGSSSNGSGSSKDEKKKKKMMMQQLGRVELKKETTTIKKKNPSLDDDDDDDDDELDAWWKDQLLKSVVDNNKRSSQRGTSSSVKSPSIKDRLDERLMSQYYINKMKQRGAGGTTAFRELEDEPTLEDDIVGNVMKKKTNFIAPSKEESGGDAAPPTRNKSVSTVQSTFDTDGMKKQQKQLQQQHNNITPSSVVGESITVRRIPQTSSPTTASALSNEDTQSHSQSLSNSVASGTLKLILTRIDDAKEQFAKALEDNDVQKQSELATLLAQLGEAAVAMNKLGQL